MSAVAAGTVVAPSGATTELVRPLTAVGELNLIPFPFPGSDPYPYPPPRPAPSPEPPSEPTSEPEPEPEPVGQPEGLIVDVWAAHLYPVDRAQQATLSAAEQQAAEQFLSDSARWHYIARRCWVRTILASYLGCQPSEVPLVTDALGKPLLEGTTNLHFNLARSGACAFLAVARSDGVVRIGVDLAPVCEPDWADQIVAGMFTAREQRIWEIMGQEHPASRPLCFTLWWAAKEAWLKATGLGLAGGLESLDAASLRTLSPGQWFNISAVRTDRQAQAPATTARWALVAMKPFAEYIGVVALGIGADHQDSSVAGVMTSAAVWTIGGMERDHSRVVMKSHVGRRLANAARFEEPYLHAGREGLAGP